MSRAVSDAFIAACNAPYRDDGLIVLITMENIDLPEPLRLCNNGVNVQSTRGVVGGSSYTYLACPIQPTISDDSEDRPPQAKLTMDNIDRRLVAAVRGITSPLTVTMELVKISDPNTVEARFTDFTLKEVSYNALTIEGTLTLEGLFSEPAIGFSYTPSYFPGLF
jgi:hypothetical protein